MKRIIVAALAAALLAGPLTVRAQDGSGGGMRGRMESRLKARLGLSDEQVSKLEAAAKAHRAEMKPLRDKARAALRKLRERVRAKASDGEVAAALSALTAARRDEAAAEEKYQESLTFLTPTQRAKLLLGAMAMRERMSRRREMRGMMRQRMRGRRGGGFGGGPGAGPSDQGSGQGGGGGPPQGQ
ncbi:MAG: periplasmic heavy metal sensor [Elusimicrobia bacterium]|nr:periplasmic heavy metal sensor [Elusimicrobiota bacterium]